MTLQFIKKDLPSLLPIAKKLEDPVQLEILQCPSCKFCFVECGFVDLCPCCGSPDAAPIQDPDERRIMQELLLWGEEFY